MYFNKKGKVSRLRKQSSTDISETAIITTTTTTKFEKITKQVLITSNKRENNKLLL